MIIFQEIQMPSQQKLVPKNYKIFSTKEDQGENNQVPGYIYCTQSLSLGKLMNHLSRSSFTEAIKKLLKHTTM